MPRPYERRQGASYPYYKLAVWDTGSLTWRDGKIGYPSAAFATIEAHRAGPGHYRLSEVTQDGRRDLEPFEIT